jgi:hypothetical protein
MIRIRGDRTSFLAAMTSFWAHQNLGIPPANDQRLPRGKQQRPTPRS